MLYVVCVLFVIFATVNSQSTCSSYDEINIPCKNPCQPTCENPTPQLSKPACQIKICEKGCVCRPYLLRDTESGACVPPSECPLSTKCERENEEFNYCASLCPRTCQSPCRNVTACILMCVQKCDCKSGFIRDESTSKCVEAPQCTKCKCRENETYTFCTDGCEETCNFKKPPNCARYEPCTVGCICAQGFVRDDKTGKCIPRNRCSP